MCCVSPAGCLSYPGCVAYSVLALISGCLLLLLIVQRGHHLLGLAPRIFSLFRRVLGLVPDGVSDHVVVCELLANLPYRTAQRLSYSYIPEVIREMSLSRLSWSEDVGFSEVSSELVSPGSSTSPMLFMDAW